MSKFIFKLKNLIFSVSLLFLSFSSYADTKQHYAIYIDAGSGGSRLYLYSYETTRHLPIIHEIFEKKVTPGLASFGDSHRASNSIRTLLDSAYELLEKNNINLQEVPVNLLSTAGMRLLTNEDQAEIYTAIRRSIKENYHFTLGKIETISGEKEALYGWLTVNYLAKNFQRNLPTFGSIDMGGASTQIAFATEANNSKNDFLVIKLDKKKYYVVNKSFLGLGLLEARKTISNKAASASCYPLDYPLHDTLVGKFNFVSCSHLYESFIVGQELNKIHPPKKTLFVAYSAIYGPLHFFKVDTQPSENTIADSVQQVCSKPWNVLEKTYAQEKKYLPYQCADATYISNLFFKGYRLSERQLLITKAIKGNKITWPLGALLYDLTNT